MPGANTCFAFQRGAEMCSNVGRVEASSAFGDFETKSRKISWGSDTDMRKDTFLQENQ